MLKRWHPAIPRLVSVLASTGLFALASSAEGQTVPLPAAPALCWLEIQPSPGRPDHIAITGHILGLAAFSGKFSLHVIKSGRGGKADTRQSGTLRLAAGESKTLSTTAVNLQPSEALSIELRLQSEGKDICSAMVSAPPASAGQQI